MPHPHLQGQAPLGGEGQRALGGSPGGCPALPPTQPILSQEAVVLEGRTTK